MSRSGFLNKVPEQEFLKGQLIDFLSCLYFFRCQLHAFFGIFLHCCPILMTHLKIFQVAAILKIKAFLAAAVKLTNLNSFKCVQMY